MGSESGSTHLEVLPRPVARARGVEDISRAIGHRGSGDRIITGPPVDFELFGRPRDREIGGINRPGRIAINRAQRKEPIGGRTRAIDHVIVAVIRITQLQGADHSSFKNLIAIGRIQHNHGWVGQARHSGAIDNEQVIVGGIVGHPPLGIGARQIRTPHSICGQFVTQRHHPGIDAGLHREGGVPAGHGAHRVRHPDRKHRGRIGDPCRVEGVAGGSRSGNIDPIPGPLVCQRQTSGGTHAEGGFPAGNHRGGGGRRGDARRNQEGRHIVGHNRIVDVQQIEPRAQWNSPGARSLSGSRREDIRRRNPVPVGIGGKEAGDSRGIGSDQVGNGSGPEFITICLTFYGIGGTGGPATDSGQIALARIGSDGRDRCRNEGRIGTGAIINRGGHGGPVIRSDPDAPHGRSRKFHKDGGQRQILHGPGRRRIVITGDIGSKSDAGIGPSGIRHHMRDKVEPIGGGENRQHRISPGRKDQLGIGPTASDIHAVPPPLVIQSCGWITCDDWFPINHGRRPRQGRGHRHERIRQRIRIGVAVIFPTPDFEGIRRRRSRQIGGIDHAISGHTHMHHIKSGPGGQPGFIEHVGIDTCRIQDPDILRGIADQNISIPWIGRHAANGIRSREPWVGVIGVGQSQPCGQNHPPCLGRIDAIIQDRAIRNNGPGWFQGISQNRLHDDAGQARGRQPAYEDLV